MEIYFALDPTGAERMTREDLAGCWPGVSVQVNSYDSTRYNHQHQDVLDLDDLHRSYGFNASSTEIAKYLDLPLLNIVYPPIDPDTENMEEGISIHCFVERVTENLWHVVWPSRLHDIRGDDAPLVHPHLATNRSSLRLRFKPTPQSPSQGEDILHCHC